MSITNQSCDTHKPTNVLNVNIFIAEDFTLKGKSTNFESVVKSSKMITGKFEKTPSDSFVYPIMKDFPAVKTGILY